MPRTGLTLKDRILAALGEVPITTPALVARLAPDGDASVDGLTYPKVDRALRELLADGRVRKVGGGRHMPHGQKASSWALPKTASSRVLAEAGSDR